MNALLCYLEISNRSSLPILVSSGSCDIVFIIIDVDAFVNYKNYLLFINKSSINDVGSMLVLFECHEFLL